MNNTERLRRIDSLLSDVPSFKCKTGCSDCCSTMMMSRLELRRIVARTGIDPKRLTAQWMLKKGCMECPLLDKDHRCSVYDIRPAICVIFGASEVSRLRCPHGLGPEKKLTKQETDTLVGRVLELGHGISDPWERDSMEWLKWMGAY